MSQKKTIRAIAFLEAFKGLLSLAAATGLFAILGKDLHQIAVDLVDHAHLNPVSHYPQIFIEAASNLEDSHLLFMAFGAAAYSLLRLVEAYGLFYERVWAEALAAGSGAVYIPIELYGIFHHVNWLGVTLLLLNIAIVVIMVRALMQRRKAHALKKIDQQN